MTENDTEYARYAGTAQGAIELAAASATAEVSRLFRWLSARSGPKQKEIAELLKVSEGRVSQVINGDGNVTIAALAKYARAYGYTVTVTLTPAEPGLAAHSPTSTERRRSDTRPTTEPVAPDARTSTAASNAEPAGHRWKPMRRRIPVRTTDTTTSTGRLR
ncbi:helix-turn-helix domain-containing protein [Nocardia sp. NPDC058658]|uniref:helix-turn-helix domain-containing protein n=1 Tax=Nocardia sp. NPDC058658 TaxID=3346580 RepID=UPI003647A792